MTATAHNNKEFAARLKEYRLERGWTLRQLASATGLAASAVWQIENARVKPHELTVRKILKALPNLEEVA